MEVSIKAFVQARMSSERFPGKVLAPFRGEPLIRHVVRAVEQVLPIENIIVVTSQECSDDPLSHYLDRVGIPVFRGALLNVWYRFQLCLRENPCDWVLRVNGDSPLLFPELVQFVLGKVKEFDGDLVTTIFPRTFPKGQNLEIIRSAIFETVEPTNLNTNDQEHVTPYFYRHSNMFRISNIDSGNSQLAQTSLAVDTTQDLERLENISREMLGTFFPPVLLGRVVK